MPQDRDVSGCVLLSGRVGTLWEELSRNWLTDLIEWGMLESCDKSRQGIYMTPDRKVYMLAEADLPKEAGMVSLRLDVGSEDWKEVNPQEVDKARGLMEARREQLKQATQGGGPPALELLINLLQSQGVNVQKINLTPEPKDNLLGKQNKPRTLN